jgi:uncharacterized membrane protein YtjA (UPF0391 family)
VLRAALIFFIIAIIAVRFGFTQIAEGAATIAQVLFYIFVVLYLIALIAGLLSDRRPPIPPATQRGA